MILKNASIADPLRKDVFAGDIRIADGKIEEISSSVRNVGTEDVFDVSGKLVMPGLVDIHVHVSHCPEAYYMLARAGVTTALDLWGMPEKMVSGFRTHGSGLTIAFLYPLIAGETLSSDNPPVSEIEKVIDYALKNGAMGLKILGGHYPLRREAVGRVIEIAAQKHCWVSVHAGTIETPGNIHGFEELVKLAGNNPVHLAHINSYCRGTAESSPLEEAVRAVKALQSVPRCCSESYLAMINGTDGNLDANGIPKSEVTKRCLIKGGFTADSDGMKKAILAGWAKVHFCDPERNDVIFPPPGEALDYYMKKNTDTFMSFAVNSPLSAIPLALAKDDDGSFVVDALATDGGAIPRNVTLKQGLALVNYGALTINELALKASLAPARLMGLKNKGFIAPGADADIIVVDPLTADVELVISGGRLIVKNGAVCGRGGSFAGRDEGEKFFSSQSVPFVGTDPEWLK